MITDLFKKIKELDKNATYEVENALEGAKLHTIKTGETIIEWDSSTDDYEYLISYLKRALSTCYSDKEVLKLIMESKE